MKIISKHNKKDFYDYFGFGYDTSDDIIFLRFPEEEVVGDKDNRCQYFYDKLPPDDRFENYVIIYNIVGIYPYCYIIPILTDNYEDITTKQQIVIPYELTLKKVEDINDFLKIQDKKYVCRSQNTFLLSMASKNHLGKMKIFSNNWKHLFFCAIPDLIVQKNIQIISKSSRTLYLMNNLPIG